MGTSVIYRGTFLLATLAKVLIFKYGIFMLSWESTGKPQIRNISKTAKRTYSETDQHLANPCDSNTYIYSGYPSHFSAIAACVFVIHLIGAAGNTLQLFVLHVPASMFCNISKKFTKQLENIDFSRSSNLNPSTL